MTNPFIGVQTLDEAKKLFHKLAIIHHPDKGGRKEDFQELLNYFHAFRPETEHEKFKGEYDQWDGVAYAEIIFQLIKIPGIEIVVCGSFIWLEGNTKPVKEQIKAIDTGEEMKRGFSPKKGQWYFSPRKYRRRSKKTHSYEEIKGMFGAEKVNRSGDEDSPKGINQGRFKLAV